MKVTIIGTGYVGLVTGVSLASLGHSVVCIGRNREKIHKINQGKAPFYEPGLDDLLKKVVKQKLLSASDNLSKAVEASQVTIVAVGTPTVNNSIDLTAIKEVSSQIGVALKQSKNYHVIVVKSTVTPKTTQNVVKPLLEKYTGKQIGKSFGLCMSPEFLREGNALDDALHPDRIIIGQFDTRSGFEFSKLYKEVKAPILFTNLATAEMIKYANNALFATLISYSNEIARICEAIKGVDVIDIWEGVHLDKRLSSQTSHYIYSGAGFGGSCLPKDTKALLAFSKSLNVDTELLKSVININSKQSRKVINLLKEAIGTLIGKHVTVLGLSFKPNSDDLRESASLSIIKILIESGAEVTGHDPFISKNSNREELKKFSIAIVSTIEEALKDADAVVLATAWGEYKKITPDVLKKNMKRPILIDGRRIFSKEQFIKEGIIYKGIGYSGE